jgi:hypothetical protein
MQKPTIHLNGTPADVLFEEVMTARRAVMDAVEKLQRAAPNGRDYYPQGDDAIRVAMAEHSNRVGRLMSVLAELNELAEYLADHVD